MAEANSTNSTSFNSFFGNSVRFGFNVRSGNGNAAKETLKEIKQFAINEVEQISNPFLNYLEKHEDVFNGNVAEQIIKTQTQMFNTSIIMNEAEEKVNGKPPRFDASF